MELKVVCDCGQKYAFDVEPVGGRMPIQVSCPLCGVDGTETANQMLAQRSPAQVPPAPAAAPAAGGLRINHAAPAAPAAPPPLPQAPRPISQLQPLSTAPKAPSKDFSMGLGILGAFIGALVGSGLVYGFWLWAGFRFPLSGIAIGALAGYGARWIGRGTHTTLGIIAGALALLAIVGTFYLIYGEFFIFGIVSIVICVGVAYRAASE